VVSDLYDRWEGALIKGIQALLVAGLVPADLLVRDTARTILTAIQGGAVMLRATGRLAYLQTALDAALQPILGALVPA
jgi:hypothetical protein